MSPVVFYGSPQGVPVKKPISLLRLLREIHIDLKKQTDLVSRCLVQSMLNSRVANELVLFWMLFFLWVCRDVVWATFPRQDEAIRFSKEHAHTKVFIYQDHLSGQRRFLVSTYDEFWRRLRPCYIVDLSIHTYLIAYIYPSQSAWLFHCNLLLLGGETSWALWIKLHHLLLCAILEFLSCFP